MENLHLNNCSIQDVVSIVNGAFGEGLSLSDFMFGTRFSDNFNSIILSMSNNNVIVFPSDEWAYTKSVSSGRSFFIKLKAAIEVVPGCQNNINASIYKAMLIHELSHVIEGSFEPLNLTSIFRKFGNENLISIFFGYCIEDIRVLNKTLKRFPFRKDFHSCLKFYDFIFTGIKGHYCGEFIVDFIHALERQLKCKKTHVEMMKINPQNFFAINGYYRNAEELVHDEDNFFSTPISRQLQAKGIKTVEDLILNVSTRVSSVMDGTIIDGIKVLYECVSMLNEQAKGCWGLFNNENPEFSPEKAKHDFFQGTAEPSSLESLLEHSGKLLGKILIPSEEKPYYDEIPSGIPMDDSPEYNPLLEYDSENRLCVSVKVDSIVLDKGDLNLMDRIVSAYPSIVGTITEQLMNLHLNQLQIKRMQRISQSFNPVGVVYASIDNNFARQQKFYDASFRNTMDYAIYYLIDASGSTGAAVTPFSQSVIDPDRNSIVLDVEKIAAAVLYSSVQHLDMPESFRQRLFLFQSHSETKIFESPDISGLALVEPNLANRDGAAIRTITKELLNEPNKTKVIFMFADGMPSDVAYNNGLFDSAMAIKESVDKGVKFFYLLTRNRKTMSFEESRNFSILTSFVTDKAVVYDPAQLPYRTRDIFSMHLL